MAVQAFHNVIPRGELLSAVLPLVIIGVTLIVGSGKAVRRAGIGSRLVGSHSRKTDIPILKEARAEYAKL